MKINKFLTTITSLILLSSLMFITGCSSKDEEETSYPYDDLIEATVVGYDDYFLKNKLWTKSTSSILDNSYSIDKALTLVFTFKRDAIIESISFDYSTEVNTQVSFIFSPNKRSNILQDYAIKENADGYYITKGEVQNLTIPMKVSGSDMDNKFGNFTGGVDFTEVKSGEKMYLTISSIQDGSVFSVWPYDYANLGVKIFNVKWNELSN